MKTVILGSIGQLGRDLVPLLSGEVIALTRQDVDCTDSENLRLKLTSLQPDVLINCAAYNLVDKAESEPQIAFANNTWAVREIALICRDLKIRLIHFSTDYVYGLEPKRTSPYFETEAPGPVSVYGISKLTGEYWVRSICPNHLVIRVCGLYGVWGSGGKGGNFVETMLRVAGQGKPLKVVNDQFCTPSFTGDIARKTLELLQSDVTGLFHMTNSGSCTWYEFAAEIFRQSHLTPSLSPISTQEFNPIAKRPSFSVLSNDKLASMGFSKLRPWQEALAEYLSLRSKK